MIGSRARIISIAALLLATLAAGGCARLGISADIFGPPRPLPTRTTAATPLPRDEAGEHDRILAAYGGAYADVKLQGWIESTVQRLEAASDRPDLHFRVAILNSPMVNAFALPSGRLYVTRGLLALTNDRAELASVLAHEMSHVVASHAHARNEQVQQAALVSRVISNVLQDPELGAMTMARSKVTLASFSRQQELDADAYGIRMAARAGFDPYGAARFLAALGRHGDLRAKVFGIDSAKEQADLLSTHPSTPERLSQAVITARQYVGPGAGARDRAPHLAALEGLTYGDDPNQGYVRGRRFIHPKLGFTLIAPEGFSLENTAQAVLGAAAGGREAMRIDVAGIGADDLDAYLASGWIDGVDNASVQKITLNGFDAATAVARGQDWSFRLYAIRFGSDVYRIVFAARQLSPEIDRRFRYAAESFRRLGSEESRRLAPLRIRLAVVKPGETADKMAARMASVDHPFERFLMINGVTRGPLKAGEKIKLVRE